MKNRFSIWFILVLTGLSTFAFAISSIALGSTKARIHGLKPSIQHRAQPSESAVKKRVNKARKRLERTKAGKLIGKSIEAHGGLAKWYSNGPLQFRYTYKPLGERQIRDTYNTVDTWSARARHQMPDNREHEYGWTGSKPWYKPTDWKPPHHVAFWSLTPYYFVAMPFVLSDPGVNLKYKGKSSLEGESFHLIYVTFDDDTGQSPDDYYYVYLDTETYRVRALRYIVAYEPFFPEGGHSDEKLLVYRGSKKVSGIVLSTQQDFYIWEPDKKTDAKKVTETKVEQIRFNKGILNAYFEIPEKGKIWEPK